MDEARGPCTHRHTLPRLRLRTFDLLLACPAWPVCLSPPGPWQALSDPILGDEFLGTCSRCERTYLAGSIDPPTHSTGTETGTCRHCMLLLALAGAARDDSCPRTISPLPPSSSTSTGHHVHNFPTDWRISHASCYSSARTAYWRLHAALKHCYSLPILSNASLL